MAYQHNRSIFDDSCQSSSSGNAFNFDVRQQSIPNSYSQIPSERCSYDDSYKWPDSYTGNTFNFDARQQNSAERGYCGKRESTPEWENLDQNVCTPMAVSFDTYGFDDGSNWQGEDLDYGGPMANSFPENDFNERNSFSSWQDTSEVDDYSGYSQMEDSGNNSQNFDFCLQGERSGCGDGHQGYH